MYDNEQQEKAEADASPAKRRDGRSLYPPKQKSWHRRPRSPGLNWYKEYAPQKLKEGRVLVIDYVKQDLSKEGTRKVAALEIDSIEGLRQFYANPTRRSEAVLRLFHVQNAPWATLFLLKKFSINASDDLVGSDFGRYLKSQRGERGKSRRPFLTGKTWETQRDVWRQLGKTSFGLDYLKPYRVTSPAPSTSETDLKCKVMELNSYDEEDNPAYAYDVYVQRLSCYIQHQEPASEIPTGLDIASPYEENKELANTRQKYTPNIDALDNGNAILIFENSHSESIEDTMIPARAAMESRWRRLPFYIGTSADVSTDDRMALQCMRMIIQDVWKSVAESWGIFLDTTHTHISILEDKIYEQPADESRAPELWSNSDVWLRVERLVYIHVDLVRECQINLRDLTDDASITEPWMESSPGDFERITNLVNEDLVKPTDKLADLMYKSVGIRDSRHSLQLSMSMWRLSWITFIFLPLTFISGFFGMNVDTFQHNPSIKWYFISTAPMMLAVFSSWYILKNYLEQSRQTPYSRGIYEHLFWELASQYPTLWSRSGPRQYVVPQGYISKLKWWLIRQWSRPEDTIRAGSGDEDNLFDGLSTWSRFKRYLLRRWTSEIRLSGTSNSETSNSSTLGNEKDHEISLNSVVAEGIVEANEVLTASGVGGVNVSSRMESGMLRVPVTTKVQSPTGGIVATGSGSPRRPRSGISAGRPSSKGSSTGRNSGFMVEEERPNWLELMREHS